MDWNLFGCARRGHVTYAPDEPQLRDRLMAPTAGGTAWRCLRCGVFAAGGPRGGGPAAGAPLIRRGKELRSELILRVFAVERFLRFLIVGGAAYGAWRFTYDRAGIQRAYDHALPAIRALYTDLGFNVSHSKLLGLVHHAFALSPRLLTLLAAGLAVYALIELAEAVGLWLGQRWGEYLAAAATSIFLPYEIYDLTGKITWLRIAALVINLLLVTYLVWTRRLFGVRGGKTACEARLRSASIIEEEQAALTAARRPRAGLRSAPTRPSRTHRRPVRRPSRPRRTQRPPPHPRHRRKTVRSSTRDTPPARVPAGQVASEAPAAGNARPTALTARLAALAQPTAEVVMAILECLPF